MMTLNNQQPFERPFQIPDGVTEFECCAEHIDGAIQPFAAYWTCPLFERGGGVQHWSVVGRQRRQRVQLRASENHERYHELVCWAFDPEANPGGRTSDVVRDSTGIEYSLFDDH